MEHGMGFEYDRRSPSDFERLADVAAHKAVVQTFAMLGIDITKQEEINALRDVLVHARKMQKVASRAGFVTLMALLTTVVTGAVSIMIIGFVEAIRSFPSAP